MKALAIFLSVASLPWSASVLAAEEAPAALKPTYIVPRDYPSIQQAIAACPAAGAVVEVRAGIYEEAINFGGKNILLRSTNPLDPAIIGATIISGKMHEATITFEGSESKLAEVRGFTILGGKSGGIRSEDMKQRAKATIANNIICNNGGNREGFGIADVDGIIESNAIHANTGVEFSSGIQRCNGVIRYNTIRENHGSKEGTGIRSCSALIEYNRIFSNTGTSGRGLVDCDGIIRGNLISANSGSSSSYGIRNSDGIIENNIICGHSGANAGAGIWLCTANIRNNTIYANSHTGIEKCAAVSIKNNIIWANGRTQISQDSRDPEFCCIQGWVRGGIGNISGNPQIRGAQKLDFRLNISSPCIDAGIEEGVDQDYFRVSRPLDGDGKDGARCDIGAVEFLPRDPK